MNKWLRLSPSLDNILLKDWYESLWFTKSHWIISGNSRTLQLSVEIVFGKLLSSVCPRSWGDLLISLPGADSSRWYKTGSASHASLSRASWSLLQDGTDFPDRNAGWFHPSPPISDPVFPRFRDPQKDPSAGFLRIPVQRRARPPFCNDGPPEKSRSTLDESPEASPKLLFVVMEIMYVGNGKSDSFDKVSPFFTKWSTLNLSSEKKVKIIHLSKNFSTNRHFGEGFWAISMDMRWYTRSCAG